MKIYYLRLFNLLSFLCITCTLAFAQPIPTTTIIRGAENGDDYDFYPNCEEDLEFLVYVANLDELSTVTIEQLYPLPNDVPNMYLDLNIQGVYSNIIPLALFEFSHMVGSTKIFKAGVTVSVPASHATYNFTATLLKNYEPGDPTPNYALPLLNGYSPPTSYSFYPIMDYNAPNHLFPCNIDGWTSCDCSNTQFQCFPYPFYPGQVHCDGPDEGGGNGFGLPFIQQTNPTGVQSQEDQLRGATTLETVNITPNPFSSAIQVQYDAPKPGALQIDLLDISGRTMLHWEKDISKGMNEINLSIDDLAPGIYLIQLSDENQSFTKKLIKS